jgi:tetratricopeptide (TPR) repeat protein
VLPTEPVVWVGCIRKYFGLADGESLNQAISACPDNEIEAFLRDPKDPQPIIQRLSIEGRAAEAGAVELMGLRAQANLADDVNRLDPSQQKAAHDACARAVAVSRELQFTECEAYFAAMLGNGALQLRRLPEATELLARSAALRRELEKASPGKYRRALATTLSNLGVLYSQQRNYPAAESTLSEVLGYYRDLEQTSPGKYRFDIARTLTNLGVMRKAARDLAGSRTALEEARGIYRNLPKADADSHKGDLATVLLSYSGTLRELRDLPAALESLREALRLFRELDHATPRVHRYLLGATLHNLGNLLSEVGDSRAAFEAYIEARLIFGELWKAEPHRYAPDLASVLDHIGTRLIDENPAAAREPLETALAMRRTLAAAEPAIYGLSLADTLDMLARVQESLGDFPAAKKNYDEAVQIAGAFAAANPRLNNTRFALILNNLAGLFHKLGQMQACAAATHKAVALVESGESDPALLWLSKAKAIGAYRQWVGVMADSGNPDRVFRALAAVREGQVRALDESPANGIQAATQSLQQVSAQVGRPVCLLAAQSLHRTGPRQFADLLLAVLDSRPDTPFRYGRAPDFADRAYELFTELQAVFNESRNAADWQSTMAKLGAAAWNALPHPLQKLLHPSSGVDVLISGDPYWAAFPWEALRFGTGDDDYLGFARPLARWRPLTGAALSRLAPPQTSNGGSGAEVVCPWDAVPQRQLLRAEAEAQSLGRDLPGLGLTFSSGGPLMGPQATLAAVESALLSRPAVFHYTGHGGIDKDEELLILQGGALGSSELKAIKQRHGLADSVFQEDALIVLNSCLTGRAREYGGQSQDLASLFLAEGAAAVIASALPVADSVGQVLGTAVYALAGDDELGDTIRKIRRLVAKLTLAENLSSYPTWCMIQYQGNPYLRLPLSASRPAGVTAGLVEACGALLDIQDMEQARARLSSFLV